MESAAPPAKRPKFGGRKPGSKNKAKAERTAAIAAAGITPLEFMLREMRRPIPTNVKPAVKASMRALQMDAAKAAAPYVHPKLGQVDIAHGTKDGKPFEITLVQKDDGL